MNKAKYKTNKSLTENNKNVNIAVDTGTSNELTRQKSVFKTKNKFKLSFFDRRKLKHSPEHSWIVTMRFANGTRKTWVIKTSAMYFTMKGNAYYLDFEQSLFDLTMNQNHIDFHEWFPTPLHKEIICEQDEQEAYYQVKPKSLKDIFDFEFIKFAVRSNKLQNWQKWLIGAGIFIVIIIVIIIVINRLSKGG